MINTLPTLVPSSLAGNELANRGLHVNRRRFLGIAAATSASAIVARPLLHSAESSPMRIIDTHQHLWDLSKFKLAWLDDAPEILKRSYVDADYQKAVKGLNVVRAIYMEVDVEPSQQQAEAEHLIAICEARKTATVAAVISGRPNSTQFGPYITELKKSASIKGVRQVLHAPDAKPGLCLEPQFVKSIRLLGELDLSFDLCMRPAELSDGVKLVDQCPQTRFIVDHCGNADPKAFASSAARQEEPPSHDVDKWKRDITELARRKNVICKISGIIASAPKTSDMAGALAPIVNFCLDAFGPDRVVFGGDWPVCLLGGSFRTWVEALRAIVAQRDTDQKRKLWYENAARWYGVETS